MFLEDGFIGKKWPDAKKNIHENAPTTMFKHVNHDTIHNPPGNLL